ncbi:MAG: TolC family protein [Sphingobacteriaceae bacterium]|nr:TolC family protein [Sphingobacteriaceae bacterium]
MKINLIFKSLMLSVAFCLFASFGAFAQVKITIQQALDSALTNNLQIKQAKLNEETSKETLKQSKLDMYPTFNVNSGQNMGWGRNQTLSGLFQNTQNYNLNIGANTSVDVFNGYAKVNQVKQNKILLDADKTNVEKVKNDLTLQVITAYLQILYNKDFLNAASEQREVAKQQVEQQQKMLDVGTKTLADLSQSKAQLATSELAYTNALNTLLISYLNLSQLMELPSNIKYEVEMPNFSVMSLATPSLSANEIFNQSLALFPDIKIAKLRTQASERGIKLANSFLYPRVSLSASYGTSFFYSYNSFIPNATFQDQLTNNISKGVGLNVNIPIFNGLQAKTNLKKAKINLLQAKNQQQLAENNLNKIINQAVADLKAAESRFLSTKNAFDAQKDAFYVTQQRYDVGLVNMLEYTNAQTNKNKAEIDFIQAKYDFIFKEKVIDYYLGKPIIF